MVEISSRESEVFVHTCHPSVRLRQESKEFGASPGYRGRPCFKTCPAWSPEISLLYHLVNWAHTKLCQSFSSWWNTTPIPHPLHPLPSDYLTVDVCCVVIGSAVGCDEPPTPYTFGRSSAVTAAVLRGVPGCTAHTVTLGRLPAYMSGAFLYLAGGVPQCGPACPQSCWILALQTVTLLSHSTPGGGRAGCCVTSDSECRLSPDGLLLFVLSSFSFFKVYLFII